MGKHNFTLKKRGGAVKEGGKFAGLLTRARELTVQSKAITGAPTKKATLSQSPVKAISPANPSVRLTQKATSSASSPANPSASPTSSASSSALSPEKPSELAKRLAEAKKLKEEEEAKGRARIAAQKIALEVAERRKTPLSSPIIIDMIQKIPYVDVPYVDVNEYINMLNSIDNKKVDSCKIGTVPLNTLNNFINPDVLIIIKTSIYIINEILNNPNIITDDIKQKILKKPMPLNKEFNINTILQLKKTDFENIFLDIQYNKTNITIGNILTLSPMSEINQYINIIYNYKIIHEINKIILIYCSYSIVISYIIPIKKKSFGPVKAETAHHNTPDEEKFIKDVTQIMDPLKSRIVSFFNTFIQELHNNLIYQFSPYNIINTHLLSFKNDAKDLEFIIPNNIYILKICMLLYSNRYTQIEKEIIKINDREINDYKVIFQENANPTIYNTILTNIIDCKRPGIKDTDCKYDIKGISDTLSVTHIRKPTEVTGELTKLNNALNIFIPPIHNYIKLISSKFLYQKETIKTQYKAYFDKTQIDFDFMNDLKNTILHPEK